MQTLRWAEIGGTGRVRVSSRLLCGRHAFPVHRHDFPEVFWITRGSGIHRINGEERPIHRGVIVFIRSRDTHGFSSDAQGVVVQNIAIHPSTVDFLKRRYFLHDDSFWNGSAVPVPHHYEVGSDQLDTLQESFHQLSLAPADIFHAERFLLNLLHQLHVAPRLAESQTLQGCHDLPGWLAHALTRWRSDVRYLSEGTPTLARLAGRSSDHVSRVLRECTGRTPTDWLNAMRIHHAAKQLEVTNRGILDISMECGFSSLGYFYTVFQQAHGCAPGVYRRRLLSPPI